MIPLRGNLMPKVPKKTCKNCHFAYFSYKGLVCLCRKSKDFKKIISNEKIAPCYRPEILTDKAIKFSSDEELIYYLNKLPTL